MDPQHRGYFASSVLSLVLLPATCLAVILVTWIIYKHHKAKTIRSEEFQERFGTLVAGMNLNTTTGVFWNPIILIRWTITNLIMLMIADHPEF